MDELFAKAPVKKVYFQLSLPLVLAMITSMIYNLADTFFVAQTGDTKLVAGVTVGAPLFTFLIAISDIFGLGGSSLVSRLYGKKDFALSKRVSSFCQYAGIISGLLTTALMLVFEKPILGFLGAKPATYQAASNFYQAIALGAVFIVYSVIPQNLIRTEGLAKESMVTTLVGTITAIILDPIFLFVFKMGAWGVGIANVIGYAVTSFMLVYYVNKKARYITLDPKLIKIAGASIKEIMEIGIPGSITNFAQSFGMALLTSSLAGYGASRVAALGITQKIYNIVILVMVGFAFGSQPLIGYNYGAKNWERLKAILRFDMLVEVVYAVISAAILLIFAHPIAALFMNKPAIITSTSYMLLATLITTPLVGLIMVYTTVFQSTGNGFAALIMALSRQGVIYFFALELLKNAGGYHGILWAQAVSDVLTCLIGYALYRKNLNFKKLEKPSA